MTACSKCGESKSQNEFPKVGKACRACVTARAVAWQKAKPDRARENKRRWRERNPDYDAQRYTANRDDELERLRERRQDPAHQEYQRDYHRAWYVENREEQTRKRREYKATRRAELSAAAVRWARENPEKRRLIVLADAARRRGAPMDADAKAYARILSADPCCYCGRAGGEIDHIVPVVVAADSGWENLTSACRSCNARKHTRSVLQFLAA